MKAHKSFAEIKPSQIISAGDTHLTLLKVSFALNPKRCSGNPSNPSLASDLVRFLKGQSYLTYLARAAFYISASGVIDASEVEA